MLTENIENIAKNVEEITRTGVPISVGFEPKSTMMVGVVLALALSIPVIVWSYMKKS